MQYVAITDDAVKQRTIVAQQARLQPHALTRSRGVYPYSGPAPAVKNIDRCTFFIALVAQSLIQPLAPLSCISTKTQHIYAFRSFLWQTSAMPSSSLQNVKSILGL